MIFFSHPLGSTPRILQQVYSYFFLHFLQLVIHIIVKRIRK
jgi:hypothetical protein